MPRPNNDLRRMLTDPHRDQLFCGLLTNEELFRRARNKLTPDLMREDESHLLILWTAASEHYDECGSLPSHHELSVAIEAQQEADVEAGEYDGIDDFLNLLSDIEPDTLDGVRLRNLLKQYLTDRLTSKLVQELQGEGVPVDLPRTLAGFVETSAAFKSLSSGGLSTSFADGWREDCRDSSPTQIGIDFLDRMMGGGACAGEVCGILGPIGGGKSTLAVQISTQMAHNAYRDWRRRRNLLVRRLRETADNEAKEAIRAEIAALPFGVSYHFSYEESPRALRILAVSNVANVCRERVEQSLSTGDDSFLSSRERNDYQEYELALFPDRVRRGTLLGERERLEQAIPWLDRHWRIVDLRGGDAEHRGRGNGGPGECAEIIATDLENYPNAFVVAATADYVGASAKRMLCSSNQSLNELRHAVTAWPYDFKQLVAVRHNCPVWVTHQLSGHACSSGPGREMQMTDAAESKSFGEGCNFVLTIGRRTHNDLTVLSSVKHRRTANMDPVVLRLNGKFARFSVATDQRYDTSLRRIISRDHDEQVGIMTAAAGRANSDSQSSPFPADMMGAYE